MPYNVLSPATAALAPATTAGNPLTSVGETLSTFRTELIANLGGRTDLSATRLNRWINWAYRGLAQMLDLKELWASVGLSLVASQPFYLVPQQLSWIKRIAIADATLYWERGRELELIDEATYRDLPDSEALGTGNQVWPTSYFRFGRMVVIWPTPGASYTAPMDFRARPVDLVADTDSPILPTEFHEPLSLSALAKASRALKLYREAAAAQNDYLVALRPLINTDAEERDAMHMVAQPVRTHTELYRVR